MGSCRLVKVSEGQRQAFKGLVEAKVVKVAIVRYNSGASSSPDPGDQSRKLAVAAGKVFTVR